jgi:serine/threonine protein kinase
MNTPDHQIGDSLPPKQLVDFEDYTPAATIGVGAQGEVRLYRHKRNVNQDSLIAVKELKVDRLYDQSAFVREVEALKCLDDPFIVQLLGIDPPTELYGARIAMRYIDSESLELVLNSRPPPSWLDATMKTIIILGIVHGMNVVHSKRIIHRDLAPKNVILDRVTHYPKICDFGLSRRKRPEDMMTSCVGTPLYRAPEVFKEEQYTEKVDVFSFGVMLYEIVTGRRIYPTAGDFPTLRERVTQGKMPLIPSEVAPFVSNLISSCWSLEADERPTFGDILCRLQENKFEVFSTVDSEAIKDFVLTWNI